MRRLIVLGLLLTPSTVLGQAAPVVPDFGWLSDGRRFAVGDIITVVVDEYTSAYADRSTSALEDRTADAGASFRGNGSGADGTLSTIYGQQSTQRGRDIRQDRLNSEVSVRVTEIEEGGSLRVEGVKTMLIDEHEQELTVRGVIRPQDITATNTIESWRVADAEIFYGAEGQLGEAKKSMLMRILGFIF